jgi:hypothetical protein
MNSKPILCVDFDGVIHSYTSPWTDHVTIPDPPVPGALQWLNEASLHFNVVINSSRSIDEAGILAMRHWFHKWVVKEEGNFENISLTFSDDRKPAAWAIQFNGDWSALDPRKLREFKPWNNR